MSFWKGLVEWSAGLAVVRSPHGAEPECAIVLMAFKTPTAQTLLSAQICGRAILIPVVHISVLTTGHDVYGPEMLGSTRDYCTEHPDRPTRLPTESCFVMHLQCPVYRGFCVLTSSPWNDASYRKDTGFACAVRRPYRNAPEVSKARASSGRILGRPRCQRSYDHAAV